MLELATFKAEASSVRVAESLMLTTSASSVVVSDIGSSLLLFDSVAPSICLSDEVSLDSGSFCAPCRTSCKAIYKK